MGKSDTAASPASQASSSHSVKNSSPYSGGNINQIISFDDNPNPPFNAGKKSKGQHNNRRNSVHSFSSGGSSGVSFKLLKACNFCRKRKIKCTPSSNGNVCQSCKEHGRECRFDHKVIKRAESKPIKSSPIAKDKDSSVSTVSPHTRTDSPKKSSRLFTASNKDYPKTMAVRSQISAAISNNVKNLSSYTGTFLDQIDGGVIEEYNKGINDFWDNQDEIYGQQTEKYTGISPMSPSGMSPYSMNSRNSLKDLYIKYIQPYTPFLSDELFENELSSFATCCINASSLSSPFSKLPESAVDSFLSMIHQELPHMKWTVMNLSCFFLLPSRIPIPREIVHQSLEAFNKLYESTDLPVNLIAAALYVDAWNSMFGETPLVTPPSVSQKGCEIFCSMDIQDFNYQIMNVSFFLYKFIWLKYADIPYEEKQDELIRFEFDMLLFPAKLSKNLMVVKDTLLSTPEAFILHILHNMLMIAYYTEAVTVQEVGKMTSIMAFPGLYHFISGMAISNFRVTNEIADRWTCIADSQVYTAKLLVKLYHIMEFETFTFTLQFYTRRPNTNYRVQDYTLIDAEVREMLKDATRDRDDDFDGAVVFWVFRDVRSMSLQLYIDQHRRSSVDTDGPHSI